MIEEPIIIEMVSSEEVYNWLNDKLLEFEGDDLNIVGTIGVMLEDLTEFINSNQLIYDRFVKFVDTKHNEEEEVFH